MIHILLKMYLLTDYLKKKILELCVCVRARASAQPEPLCVCTRACSQNHQPPKDLAPPPPPNPSKMTTIINYSNPKPNIKPIRSKIQHQQPRSISTGSNIKPIRNPDLIRTC